MVNRARGLTLSRQGEVLDSGLAKREPYGGQKEGSDIHSGCLLAPISRTDRLSANRFWFWGDIGP